MNCRPVVVLIVLKEPRLSRPPPAVDDKPPPPLKLTLFLDTNECALRLCKYPKICRNSIGSYSCYCRSGYTEQDGKCKDIDECATKKRKCSGNAHCINTIGSSKCQCNDGFRGNGAFCRAIVNECAKGTDKCDKNAMCTDTVTSYRCSCKTGFRGTGYTCKAISSVNEVAESGSKTSKVVTKCSTHKKSCHVRANCLDTPDGHKCECKPGFSGNGKLCLDINECRPPSKCGSNSYCRNTAGSFVCTCRSGFKKSGDKCVDINECTLGKTRCHKYADCTNSIGSYKCSCKSGYRGTGYYCRDIEECSERTHDCHVYAECINTAGSFDCNCLDGFNGNGKYCFANNAIVEPELDTADECGYFNEMFRKSTKRKSNVYVRFKIYLRPGVKIQLFGSRVNYLFIYPGGTIGTSAVYTSSRSRFFGRPILSPAWGFIPSKFGQKSLNYTVLYESDLKTPENIDVKICTQEIIRSNTKLKSFEPTLVIVFSWHITGRGTNKKTSRYDVLLINNGLETYVLFKYKELNWDETMDMCDKFSGVSFGNGLTHELVKYSGTAKMDKLVHLPGNYGELGMYLFHASGPFNVPRDKETFCKTWSAKQNKTFISELVNTLPSCPCSIDEVKLDDRFQLESTTPTVDCYYLKNPTEDGTGQECCYGTHGNDFNNLITTGINAGHFQRFHYKQCPKFHYEYDSKAKHNCNYCGKECENSFNKYRPTDKCK
ncbi:unnamed protein product [Owenia fusiformis]|uniref:Uncharacterized protein n=1 Tax=Owenia fusiformis TaxID=6347 RepID=A0A8S4PJQ9_OWEFU|nr:unnamed protein product [Owenia fusiformis]